MKRRWGILLLGVIFYTGLMFLGCKQAAPAEPKESSKVQTDVTVLASVGPRKITTADLDKKLEEIPTYARSNFQTKEGKMKLLDRIIRNELLMRAAEDAGYDKRPDIQEKLRDARERILTSEYFKNELGQAEGSSDEDLKQYYEKNKEKYKTDESLEARQVVVETESQAKELVGKLNAKELTFEKAVEEFSKDPSTKDSGGKMGLITKGGFIKGIGRSKEFEEKVFALDLNQISEPISSRQGFHIVIIDKKNPSGYKPFDEVKQQIAEETLVSDEAIEKEYKEHQEDYKTRAKVKIKHIQVETQEKAEKVYGEIQGGAKFDDLVDRHSTDASTVKQKGNLGYLYRDGYIKGIGKDAEFEKAVFAMKEGEISKPIKTQKGWHVVQVEEKTEEAIRPLEEVRTQIRSKLMRDQKDKGMETQFDALKQKYATQIYEDRIQDSSPDEAVAPNEKAP